jgi:hypothetical protein
MKPFYSKIVEQDKVTFIKVVGNDTFGTASILIQSSENSWTTQLKVFDLNTEKDRQGYAALIEGGFESNRKEFLNAVKQVLRHGHALSKRDMGQPPGNRKNTDND